MLPHNNSAGWHLDSNVTPVPDSMIPVETVIPRAMALTWTHTSPPAYFEGLNKLENGLISNIDCTNLGLLISFEKDALARAYSSQAVKGHMTSRIIGRGILKWKPLSFGTHAVARGMGMPPNTEASIPRGPPARWQSFVVTLRTQT